MSETSIKSVAKRAFGEAAEAVRWNKPVSVMIALVVAAVTFGVTFAVTGQIAWSAVAGIGVPTLFLSVLFVWKMVSVPLAIAKEASARAEAALAELADRRDPDGIYQHGVQVGMVRLPIVQPSQSAAQFDQIIEAADFDITQPFEYREWVLRLISRDAETGGQVGGRRLRVLHRVQATITARR
jgi:uncharacterized membrane protein YhdT